MRACTISCLLLFLFIIPTITPATVTFHNSCKYKVTLTGGATKQTIKSGQVIKFKDIPDAFDLKVEMPKTGDSTPPTFSCHVDKVRDGSRYVILPAEYTNPVDIILSGPGGQRTVLPQVMRFDQDGSKTWICPTESERKALVDNRTHESDTKIKDRITKQEAEQQKVIKKTIKKLAAKKEIAKLKGSSEQEPKKEAEKKAQEEKPVEEETVQEESEQVQEETPAEPEAETESTEEEDVA